MKEFPPQKIEGTKQFFETQKFPVELAQLGEIKVSYFVIPQELNPQLKDFALRMTTTDPTTQEVSGIFGVSNSVPTELRPYWAAHEVIEFTQIGINQEGRCALAEEKVVKLVPSHLKDAYVNRRTDFFTDLIAFFKDDLQAGTGNYTQGDLQEVEATLEYLRRLKH